MFVKVTLWIAFILPWFTLIFMKKERIKRFMPVTIFTCLLVTIVFDIGYTYKWWVIHTYIFPWGFISDTSFVFGLFAVSTIWIFHLTYERVWLYFITNFVIDLVYSMVGFKALKTANIATIQNIKEWQVFLLYFSLAIIIFLYQRWQETIFVSN